MIKILTVIGTRPEIIKMWPIIQKLDNHYKQKLLFTGQHYSSRMVKRIFHDIHLRQPDFFIKLSKKKNPFFEMQRIIYEIIIKIRPSAVIYHGDTFTTLAASVVTNFYFPNIINIHIEGGYRSKDENQIEERIRTIADKLSKVIFVQRKEDKINLKNEVSHNNIFIVGNSIADSVKNIKKNKLIINQNKFIFCSFHRAENTDNLDRLIKIVNILNYASSYIVLVLSLHPRTKKILAQNNIILSKKIIIKNTLTYSETIQYIKQSFFVISDSGGIQEESVILNKKCLVLLDKTPHSYYLGKDANQLLNLNISQFKKILFKLLKKNKIIVKSFYHKSNVADSIYNKIKEIL